MFGNRQGGPGGLSINTSAANTSGPGGSGQAPKSGGLFGPVQQTKPASTLFGSSTATSQPQSTNLFGTSNNTLGGGLFGISATTSQTQQGSNFSAGTNNQGGLFGNPTASQPQQNSNPFGSSLFGGTGNTTQQPQGGGTFGGPSTQQGSGMFGQSTSTQGQSNSIFGTSTSQQQQGGLFGSSLQPQNNSILGASGAQSKPSIFGTPAGQSQTQAQAATQTLQPPAPSIFTASIGQLSQQQQTVPGVRVSVNELRPTTRFNDLHEELQKTIENIDNFITEQMQFQTQCEQALEGQGEAAQRGVALAAETIPSDVKQCQNTLDAVQQALENDAQTIAQVKALTKADAAHASLSFKALSILRMPQQFQNSSMWSVPNMSQLAGPILVDDDLAPGIATNLVSYFSMQADDMSKALESYRGRIEEVETYLTGLEASMTTQVQQLMFVRDHDGGPKSAEDQVKELAAVLNEMDAGIVGVAGKVSLARDQVQEIRISNSSDRRHGRY